MRRAHKFHFSFATLQTGSGKTFTMQGPETASGIRGEYRGLIPRSLEHLFHITKLMSEDGWRTELTVECVEVYNETFRDLLSGSAESACMDNAMRCLVDRMLVLM